MENINAFALAATLELSVKSHQTRATRSRVKWGLMFSAKRQRQLQLQMCSECGFIGLDCELQNKTLNTDLIPKQDTKNYLWVTIIGILSFLLLIIILSFVIYKWIEFRRAVNFHMNNRYYGWMLRWVGISKKDEMIKLFHLKIFI